MFDAVADGRIKALWIMSTNPVVSVPNAEPVKAALAKCPFVVVSDITRRTDTAAFADVLLLATAWGEKDGTVTNSERRMSRQQRQVLLRHPPLRQDRNADPFPQQKFKRPVRQLQHLRHRLKGIAGR